MKQVQNKKKSLFKGKTLKWRCGHSYKSGVHTLKRHSNPFISLCRKDEARHAGWAITLGATASLHRRLVHPASVQWQPKLSRTNRWVSNSTRPATFPEELIMTPGQQPARPDRVHSSENLRELDFFFYIYIFFLQVKLMQPVRWWQYTMYYIIK